eukprot:scaffold1672_cov75-Phaeocystis_antarctica.AAC.7
MPKNIMSVKKSGGRKCSTSPVMPTPVSPKMDLAATVQPVPAVRAMMNTKALTGVHLGSWSAIYSPLGAEPGRWRLWAAGRPSALVAPNKMRFSMACKSSRGGNKTSYRN